MPRFFRALLTSTFMLVCTVASAELPNSLIGVVTSAPNDPKLVGSQFTFTGLKSNNVIVVWPSAEDEKMTKIFEDVNLTVIQFVSSFGGTETVYLDRKNKRFTFVYVTAIFEPVEPDSIRVGSYQGILK